MKNITIASVTPENIKRIFLSKGYKFFENDTKDFNLNIFGIRSAEKTVDTFNDYICLMWKFNGIWTTKVYPATTESGLYYLQNPMNSTGTKILKEGQYLGVFDIGLHQGKYEALKQIADMLYHLDNDRDNELDFTDKLYKGTIGSNIHHAGEVSQLVGKWSAACQVLQKLKDWAEFIGICKKSKAIYNSKFSYTLINENDFLIK